MNECQHQIVVFQKGAEKCSSVKIFKIKSRAVFGCIQRLPSFLYICMNYCFISQDNNNFGLRIYYKEGGFIQEGHGTGR